MKLLWLMVSLILVYSVFLNASEEKYRNLFHEIRRERQVSLFMMKERLHAIDIQLTALDCYRLSHDCPYYLMIEYRVLLDDRTMLKNLINHFKE